MHAFKYDHVTMCHTHTMRYRYDEWQSNLKNSTSIIQTVGLF